MYVVHKIDGIGMNCWVNARQFDHKKHTIVFIHGSGGDHTVWIHQYTQMKDRFNIAALDLPGHGRSEGKGEQDVALYVEWVRKIIKELNLRKPVLIGHSLGAAISLTFAIKYGDLLSGIVPVGGGVRMPVNEVILEGIKTDPAAVIALAAKFSISKINRDRLMVPLYEALSKVNPDIIYGDFLACNRLDITNDILQIKTPALVICGTDDKMMPPPMSQFLADNILGARLVLIESAGHMVMLEEVNAFNREIRMFIESLHDMNGN
jgi:pimeloyl-ACP methyl ester carboxylesterase